MSFTSMEVLKCCGTSFRFISTQRILRSLFIRSYLQRRSSELIAAHAQKPKKTLNTVAHNNQSWIFITKIKNTNNSNKLT